MKRGFDRLAFVQCEYRDKINLEHRIPDLLNDVIENNAPLKIGLHETLFWSLKYIYELEQSIMELRGWDK